MAPPPRTVVGCALLVAIGLAVLIAATIAQETLLRSPSRERAATALRGAGDLIAYEVWDGVPHAVVRERPGRWGAPRVIFDHLTADPVSIAWPPVPAWQLTGAWYVVAATDVPASLGVARCTGINGEACIKETELFGQINAAEIVALEVLVEGAWRRYPVAPPGFAVRLDGFRGRPTDYRWVDAAGRVVWTAAQDPSVVAPWRGRRDDQERRRGRDLRGGPWRRSCAGNRRGAARSAAPPA